MSYLSPAWKGAKRGIASGLVASAASDCWQKQRQCNTSVTDGLQILHNEFVKDDPEIQERIEQERANAEIAQMLYDLRINASLTQGELAEMVGTSASVICRLEDADYEGYFLAMLRRIAGALGQWVELRVVPKDDDLANTMTGQPLTLAWGTKELVPVMGQLVNGVNEAIDLIDRLTR